MVQQWYKRSFDAMSEGMVLCIDHEDRATTFATAHDQVCALAAGLAHNHPRAVQGRARLDRDAQPARVVNPDPILILCNLLT